MPSFHNSIFLLNLNPGMYSNHIVTVVYKESSDDQGDPAPKMPGPAEMKPTEMNTS